MDANRREVDVEAYGIWNNKGGTGKSTITFHIASRFAEKNPDKKVLVIDLCPQANASMLLLGGGIAGEQHLLDLCSKANPESVVGYVSDAILSPKVVNLYYQSRHNQSAGSKQSVSNVW